MTMLSFPHSQPGKWGARKHRLPEAVQDCEEPDRAKDRQGLEKLEGSVGSWATPLEKGFSKELIGIRDVSCKGK